MGESVFASADTIAASIGEPGTLFNWAAFDGLTAVDRTGKPQPDLATSWSSPDAKTWTFKLRTDIKFQDGTPFDSSDVAGTFNWYKNPANKAGQLAYFSNVDTVTATDPGTVTIVLKTPLPSFPKQIAWAMVLKGRAIDQTDPKALDFGSKAFFGTGPYKPVSFQANSSMEFDAMPAGFVSPRGSAAVQKLIVKAIPDPASRVAALKAGDVQLVDTIPTDQIAPLKGAGFGTSPFSLQGAFYLTIDSQNGPTKDVRVRQALNYAIDKNSIIQNLLTGTTTANSQIIGSSVLGYNSALQPYSFDPNKAKAMLADAGFGSGLDIGPISFRPDNFPQSVAEAMSSQLGQVGVTSKLQAVDVPTWLKAYTGPQSLRPGLYEFGVSWDQTWEADSVYRWWSSDLPDSGGRKWDNQQFDDIFQQAKKTISDTDRGKLYQQDAQILHDQAPVVFLWDESEVYAYDAKKVSINPGMYADVWTTQINVKS